MAVNNKPKFVIVGGGLGGALLAVYLGREGYEVDVYEMRPDLREGNIPAGRSINLALSHRGICALDKLGLAERVLASAVPMPGRMMHATTGALTFQPYGKDPSHVINSVSRGVLNGILLDAAEACEHVRLFFDQKCVDVDPDTGAVTFEHSHTKEPSVVEAEIVVGADGAFSAVRSRMQRLDRFDYSQTYLEHGYKELSIPAGAGGAFQMEKHALHIWPRRSFMMIALPNQDGSFTCTLFWPFEGRKSFAALKTEADVRAFFGREFPDAVPLMPTLVEDYFHNPTSSLVTIRCGPWYVRDRIVLIGDACHAVVPFYGQGMNASFEDVLVLNECMARHRPDWETAFREYYHLRKDNVDTLADMALANFVEMRDHTGSRLFLLKKKKEHLLHKLFPRWYVPLYTLATFTRTPYTRAVRQARLRDRVVRTVVLGLAILLVVAIGAAVW